MSITKRVVPMAAIVLAAMLAALVPVIATAGTIVYYHNDLAGSPIAATNESGQVIWRESYRPYGERLTSDPDSATNKIWFTSRSQDAATGLVYMGARWYDPVVGRFVSTDPKRFDEQNLHSFNRYAYANNNPQKYVDPDGRAPFLLALIPIVKGALAWGSTGFLVHTSADAVSQAVAFGNVDWKGAGQEGLNAAPAWAAGGVLGEALVVGTATSNATKEATTVIGRVKDLQNFGPGERSLLDRLPDLSNPKGNWQQNAGLLRGEMRRGQPIRDASPGDAAGQFLNAERNLLRDRGWTFDSKTNFWMPPGP